MDRVEKVKSGKPLVASVMKSEMENSVHESFHIFEIKVEKDEVHKNSSTSVTETSKIFEPIKLSQEDAFTNKINLTDLEEQNIKLESCEYLPDLSSLHTEIKIEEDKIDADHSPDLTEHKIARLRKKLFQCDTCTRTFTKLSDVKKHERIHTGEKPFKCNICFKTFARKDTLNGHERMHTGKKPYKCNTCSKTFKWSSDLRKHERIHSGEKPYQCNVCFKKFNQSNDLRAHERIHSGKKPYECNICSKTFTKSSYLINHERTHSDEKSYKM